ncbi:MAG: transposase [Lachnospiraceae bacterium]|nr:transposase [Lachnospiraceae bacterium]MCM1257631.1 transposase [Roseburia sp.]
MAKHTQDLKPDTILKNYWNDNRQFADFFNAVLFHGQQIISPQELVDADTDESSLLEHREYAESIRASRDNIKICKKSLTQGVSFAMLGIESQEHVHYAMPMRILGYDYGIYKKQYEDNAKKFHTAKGLAEDEYLSRMKKTDKFAPVITVVIYYGDTPWDGAVTLHEMLDIPDRMKPFVNDYKMFLVEARQNDLTLHNTNNIAFFDMLKVVLANGITKEEARKKVIEYAKEHEVDKTVVMTVAGAANLNIDYHALSRKGDVTMCTLFEEIKKEGIVEGIAKGKAEGIIETGLDLGLSETDILERLQHKLNVSLQKAQEYFNMFGKQAI